MLNNYNERLKMKYGDHTQQKNVNYSNEIKNKMIINKYIKHLKKKCHTETKKKVNK